MTWLDELNAAPESGAVRAQLAECCAADSWIDAILSGRPYSDAASLLQHSDSATLGLDDAGFEQALAGHPRIGERAGAGHSASSSAEQAGMTSAADDVRAQIAAANLAYEQQFGHVYLVCASGRSAEELLAMCVSRLDNDPATERRVALHELAAINRIRLAKLVAE